MFDGPNRPPVKRNKKIYGPSHPDHLSKELFQLFNVPCHTAPGEAEAECALLQREGTVDAVLSEDVDTLMFGATTTLRNWTSEGPRGSKTPTHVNVYTAKNAGIDSDGMILVALMSGGDYIPAGISNCGIKIAWQAARAGFGRDLCHFSGNTKDPVGLRQWRAKLEHELQTNESGFFKAKHKALKIPANFPDMAVLRYYTHPEVSSAEIVLRFSKVNWNLVVDVPRLRKFVAEAFEWNGLPGARKLVRGLAPALLVHGICQKQRCVEIQSDDERKLITSICGTRTHFSTDGMPELRLEYTPIEIVGLDLELEKKEGSGLAVDSNSEAELDVEQTQTQVKQRERLTYNPTSPERLWVLESYVKLEVPLMVEAWEEALKMPLKTSPKKISPKKPSPKKPSPRKAKGPKKPSQCGMRQRTMDSFLRVSKPNQRVEAKRQPASNLGEVPNPTETEATQKSGKRGVESQPMSSPREGSSQQGMQKHASKFLDPTRYIE